MCLRRWIGKRGGECGGAGRVEEEMCREAAPWRQIQRWTPRADPMRGKRPEIPARHRICPVVPLLRTAKRPEPARLAAKLALLRNLKIPALTGRGRGVPGVLRHSYNSGNFSSQPGDSTAYSGSCTEDFSQRMHILAVCRAKLAAIRPN
jgi:hypothetical protein